MKKVSSKELNAAAHSYAKSVSGSFPGQEKQLEKVVEGIFKAGAKWREGFEGTEVITKLSVNNKLIENGKVY